MSFDLQKQWVKRSVDVEKTKDLVADFVDLVESVKQEFDVVNSLFGLRTLNHKFNPKSTSSIDKATVEFLKKEKKSV